MMDRFQNYVVGDELSIQVVVADELTRFTTTVAAVEDAGVWLTAPRDGATVLRLRCGTQMSVVARQGPRAMAAEMVVLASRPRHFLASHPSSWTLLTRRASERIATELDVQIGRAEDLKAGKRRAIPGRMVELSSTGARIHSRAALRTGALLLITFSLPDVPEQVSLICEVVRIVSASAVSHQAAATASVGFQVGVRFLKLRATHAEMIDAFVAERVDGAGTAKAAPGGNAPLLVMLLTACMLCDTLGVLSSVA